MGLGSKRPQMSRQLELALEGTGEARRVERGEEERTANHGNERLGASDLMEQGVRTPEPSGRIEASEKEQGQPRHRRDDGG